MTTDQLIDLLAVNRFIKTNLRNALRAFDQINDAYALGATDFIRQGVELCRDIDATITALIDQAMEVGA